ncbi:MAG TPA: DUF748 domain-containing protein [Verrucomicrobiae bacterium]|nr:DUF748 domain-containing protein [Verrucomicrobiae bacterium]
MKGRWGRKLAITVGIIVVILVAARLALPRYVLRYVNNKLDELPNYGGRVADVDIHLIRGAYTIKGVNIVKESANAPPEPFVAADEIDFSVDWSELFHGSIVGEIVFDRAKLNFIKAKTEEESQTSIDKSWTKVVQDLFPFKINRFVIRESQITYKEPDAKPPIDLAITNFTAVATNLTNSREVVTKLPATLKARGRTIGGGDIAVALKFNPLQDQPTFDLNLALTNVDMTSLNNFFEAYAKANVKRGTFDVIIEMYGEDGRFEGYVKPIMKDLDMFELKQDAKNPLKLAWQAVLAGVVKIFKNQPKDQVATKIPVSGTIDKKGIDLWTTLGNVLRNAFVHAFSPTFDQTVGPSKDLTEDPKIEKDKSKDEKKEKKSDSPDKEPAPVRRDKTNPG